MTDELLPYYDRELEFIRDLGAEFAKANPKIAGRLRWSNDSSEDPHVSRMIEAFAFLNARIRHKLEDDFPEAAEALLGILYPHYLAPTPSASIIQCQLDRSQAELTSGYAIPRGTHIETEPIDGQPCRFRTCYDTTVWPIALQAANYQGQPFQAPAVSVAREAKGVVRITLETFSKKTTFSQFKLEQLRFFLSGEGQYIHDLYETIHNNSIGVAIAAPGGKGAAVMVPDPPGSTRAMAAQAPIRPVGFESDQGLLDYSARSFLGYRLLSEYFSFPEKFMFFDLVGITPQMLATVGAGNQLELFIFVDRHVEDLERSVDAETFRLGCCPIVNLYKQRAEPIRWNHSQYEYRVIPDARRPTAHEIYSIDRVIGTSPTNEEIEFFPFYAVKHGRSAKLPVGHWHARRQAAGFAGGQVDYGTELYLSLVDLQFDPAELGDWTVDVETTCLNRDLPARLPFGGGQPKLQFAAEASLARASCLTAPTPTHRPALRQGTRWQLISHLTLNHISLAADQDGADALREILKLYDVANSDANANVIAGLRDVSSRRIVGRVGGQVAAGFCRGLEVTLHFDEERFRGSGVYLFSAVLERFLGLYSSLNSFTKTVVTTTKRNGTLAEWRPRAGEQVLI